MIPVKSFHGASYSEVGEMARQWAHEHRQLLMDEWHETARWDGGRIARHPSGYRISAWSAPVGVSAVLEIGDPEDDDRELTEQIEEL